jgi:hypothetical protein
MPPVAKSAPLTEAIHRGHAQPGSAIVERAGSGLYACLPSLAARAKAAMIE